MQHPQRVRDEIIGAYKNHTPPCDIARNLGLPPTSVLHIIQRYKDTGSSEPAPRSGRPSKITPQLTRLVLRDITNDPSQPWASYGEGRGIGGDTVKKIAEGDGLHKRHARAKPFLRPEHIQARLKWAEDYSQINWKPVIFTDEVSFELGWKGGVAWTIRRVHEECDFKHLKGTFRQGRKTIMVWGAIAYGHKWRLLRLTSSPSRGTPHPPKLDRFSYVNNVILGRLAGYCSELRREGLDGVMVVEDGAPIHRNELAAQAREENHIKNIDHPPSSPDLNAIEPLWGVVKHRLSKLRPIASTVDMLWEQIQMVWAGLEQDLIDRQVERMEARVEAVKKAHGLHTGF